MSSLPFASSAPEIRFAQVERAPDEIFLRYIFYYIDNGGKDLKALCSASKIMNRRCNQFRKIIQQRIPKDVQAIYRKFSEAAAENDIDLVDRIVLYGGSQFRDYLLKDSVYGALIFHTFYQANPVVKSTEMVDRIFSIASPERLPHDFGYYLLDFVRDTQSAQIARYIFSKPTVRERFHQTQNDSLYAEYSQKLLQLDANFIHL